MTTRYRETFYALVHRTCEHIGAGPSPVRSMVEAQHTLIQAAGYHRWRVRTVDLTAETLARIVACDTCRIDPTRGLQPEVGAAMAADPEMRRAAALGAAAHIAAEIANGGGGRL
jgi:hypothetical protein